MNYFSISKNLLSNEKKFLKIYFQVKKFFFLFQECFRLVQEEGGKEKSFKQIIEKESIQIQAEI